MKCTVRVSVLLLAVCMLLSSLSVGVGATGGNKSLTISQLASSAATVESTLQTAVKAASVDDKGVYYNILAPTLTVGSLTLAVEDYVLVAAQALLSIEEGSASTKSLSVKSVILDTGYAAGANIGTMSKNMLLDLANRISIYGDTTGKMRNSFSRPEDGANAYNGRVCLYSIAQAFAAALKSYNTTGALPDSVSFLPTDFGARVVAQPPVQTPEIISDWYTNIILCSYEVKNYVEANKKLPSTLNYGGTTMSMAQYCYLAGQAIVNISNGITTGTLKFISLAEPSNPTETLASGQILATEYIDIATRLVNFCEANGQTPNYSNSSLGQMHYHTLIYMFARLLCHFGDNGEMPSGISVELWSKTNGTYVEGSATFGNDYSAYGNYLQPTSNCQSNNATIISVAKTGMNYGGAATSTYSAMYNLMNYLNDNLAYDYYYDTQQGALNTWNYRSGNCCDCAHLMIACARSLGVPGRYVHGYCRFSSGLTTGHVWAEVLCGSEWYTADLVSDYNYLGYKTSTTLELYNRYVTLPF